MKTTADFVGYTLILFAMLLLIAFKVDKTAQRVDKIEQLMIMEHGHSDFIKDWFEK